MTQIQVQSLNLGISPVDVKAVLIVESALSWVKENTTLDFDFNDNEDLAALPAAVKLFVLRFVDVMATTGGVQSESIEGLSQSFASDKSATLWSYAEELLAQWLKSSVSFVPASQKWRY